ncbi:MAG: hypothetical protein D6715_14245 [Calditrichaeota bacterium]|nr:MAG: hypothetical protein D6715_14245 [Calditrichota bacterium]
MSDHPAGLEEILAAWYTNHRINEYLIDHISDEGMRCTLSRRGGRNVLRQFCHLHNVRYWQLEKRAPDLVEQLYKFATREEPDRAFLKACLADSTERVARFFERAVLGTGRARTHRKGVITSLSYFIAHESHHRGSILLTLKQCGHSPEQSVRYAIWDWDRM